jgi:pyruvate formate lyase activating enzyme
MIADFKSPCPEKTSEILGADIDVIKSNLIHRAKTGKPLLVRVPLIHYFNCGEKNAREFGEFFTLLQSLGTNDNVSFEILTYHEFGKEKYEKLNLPYTVTDGFVSTEDVKAIADELKKRNLKIINT